jgi:signal peptidase I
MPPQSPPQPPPVRPTLPPASPSPVTYGTPRLPEPTPSSPEKSEGWRSILSTLLILIAAPLVALALTAFVFQSYEVDGPSMESTLQNHDRLIVLKVPRTISRVTGNDYIPKRGDVIIFVERRLPELGNHQEKQLIKRVIGIPGDRVVVKDGLLTIYNAEHPNGFNPDKGTQYIKDVGTTPGDVDITVSKGEVFVCGDNRVNSIDSRYLGTVQSRDIVGKLIFRVFPLNKAELF